MADTPKLETAAKTTEQEEREWRERILEELHRLNRSIEKIADRLGGMNIS